MGIAITPDSLLELFVCFLLAVPPPAKALHQGITTPSLAPVPLGTKGWGRGPLAATAHSGATLLGPLQHPLAMGTAPPGLPFHFASPAVMPCRSCPPSKAAATGVLVLQPALGKSSSVRGKGKRKTPSFPKAQPAFSEWAAQGKSCSQAAQKPVLDTGRMASSLCLPSSWLVFFCDVHRKKRSTRQEAVLPRQLMILGSLTLCFW